MYGRKPQFYLQRLEAKGWTQEEIQKKTRIHNIRLKKLYMPNCVPTREEMLKINALFRLTPPCRSEEVKQVWKETMRPVETKYEGPKLTDRQKTVLQQLRDSAHREVILTSTEARVAGRLVSPGLVSKRVDEKDEESVRFYSITDDGLSALNSLGL
tara:strand:+ start:5129 stop:5596 length:468 start_codon:yes stop_codon:yes gene_type:complete